MASLFRENRMHRMDR